MRGYLVPAVLLLMALAFTGCSPAASAPDIEINDAWVRAPDAMTGMDIGSPSALFMVIRNHGDSADTLQKVESDIAGRAQIHLTEVDANGVASMPQVEGLEIPAGGAVELKSGSFHIMLMDIKHELREGEILKFVLTFEHAGPITVEAPVRAP